jgi:diguanylate cyclase (GGDEF)-like protein
VPDVADQALTHPGVLWALAALAIIADLRPFPLAAPDRRVAPVFLSACFTVAILLLAGVRWAIVVQAAATAVAAVRLRLRPERALVLLAQFTFALIAAAAVLRALNAPAFHDSQRLTSADGLAFALAVGAWFVANYGVFLVWLRIRQVGSWRRIFTPTLGYSMLGTGAVVALAPIFVGAPTGWALPLLVIPILTVSQLAWLYSQQRQRLRYDSLTGLRSRQAFVDHVDDLARYHPSERFALMVLDLDRFRQINTTLGHAVGNRLLTTVADRLLQNVRATDTVARLGGDEFAILQPRVADACAAVAFADHLIEALAVPAIIEGEPIDIDASIGVTISPEHGRDSATLLRHAEVALFEAKQRVSTTAAVYTAKEDATAAMRWSLLTDPRRALQSPKHRNEVTFAYQPQVSLATGKVVAVEALLRWHHPERGLVNVGDILAAIEHSPIMAQLTERVIEDVLTQVARWNAAGISPRASINVSVRDLETPELLDTVTKALHAHEVPASQLTIEVTETALMAELQQAQTTLRELADLGVAISLDDFGTGYSSMSHLRRLPVHEIKIDSSFTTHIASDSDDRAIVRSIIDLGHDLGLRVVAEGVEDEETRCLLGKAGCDVVQGWLIARPMPSDQLPVWLADRSGSATSVA